MPKPTIKSLSEEIATMKEFQDSYVANLAEKVQELSDAVRSLKEIVFPLADLPKVIDNMANDNNTDFTLYYRQLHELRERLTKLEYSEPEVKVSGDPNAPQFHFPESVDTTAENIGMSVVGREEDVDGS